VKSLPEKVSAIFIGILRGITYYFSFYRETVLSFYTEKYKNIQTKLKVCKIPSVIAISNTL